MTTPTYNVPFLCTGNSARSIRAEAIPNASARGQFQAFRAGSQPMTAHWEVPDPAAVEGREEMKRKAFLAAYLQLRSRINIFLSLPLGSLDRISLNQELKEIGRIPDSQ
jgi:protein-tyrosine-phosphatase